MHHQKPRPEDYPRKHPAGVPPAWLGKALAIAKHQDDIASWPRWARWAHRLFIARRCPCCIAAKAMKQENRHALKRIRLE